MPILGLPADRLATAKTYSANTTLRYRDFTGEGLLIADTSGITLTLPTPAHETLAFYALIGNSSNGNITLSGAFFGGASSYTLAASAMVQLVCGKTGVRTYKWMVFGTSPSDSRFPADTAAITPTLAWTTHDATVSAGVYRAQVINKRCFFNFDITCSDGKDAAGLTITMPTGYVPADVDSIVPVRALVKIDTAAYAAIPAYIDGADGTAGNRKLTVLTGTLTDAAASRIIISGNYELP